MLETGLWVLALLLLLEGIGPALFPNRWRNWLLRLGNEPVNQLRHIGIGMLVVALVLALVASQWGS